MDPSTAPEVGVVFKLVVYGPLGILALLSVLANIKLYKDNKAERKEHAEQLAKERADCERERKEHAEQKDKLEERYIEKTEKQLIKYHELVESLNKLLDAAFRRYPRPSEQSYGERPKPPG